MKKWFGTMGIIIGCLGLIPVGSLHAQQIVAIDFSKAQGYVDGPIIGQPAGQAVKWQDGGGNATGFPVFTLANETLVVAADGADGGKWLLLPIKEQTGKFTVTFDWQYVGPADGSVDVGFCISDTANFNTDGDGLPTFNEEGVMCRMQEVDKVIDARNGDLAGGGAYAAFEVVSFTDGKKFSMRYEVNAAADVQTFNVFVRPEGAAEVSLAEDFGFRRGDQTGLNVIAIWEDGNFADTKVIIDNIKITGPATVTDWELHE